MNKGRTRTEYSPKKRKKGRKVILTLLALLCIALVVIPELMIDIGVALIVDPYLAWRHSSKYIGVGAIRRELDVRELTLEAFEEAYGEPYEKRTNKWANYSGWDYKFSSVDDLYYQKEGLLVRHCRLEGEETPNDAVHRIFITGEELRLGPRNIGVGSTREAVERAFYFDTQLTQSTLEHSIQRRPYRSEEEIESFSLAYRGNYDIYFKFDENDCVQKILIDLPI